MRIKLLGLTITSNPGKWVRRQALGGKPVTAGSVLDRALEVLGYASTGELVLALVMRNVTVSDIEDKLAGELRDVVLSELLNALGDLQISIRALAGAPTDPPDERGPASDTVKRSAVLAYVDSATTALPDLFKSADAAARGNYEQFYARSFQLVEECLAKTRTAIERL